MKVGKRSVPLDMLSLSEGEHRVTLSTHRSTVCITVEKAGRIVHVQQLTFSQLVSLLMRDAKP